MTYSIRHVTNFRYEPAIRESLMEVRMQPRSDARQRCLTFSLDVNPQANIMSYQDFLGNTVHHFDIPGRQKHIQITAQAIVEVREPVHQPIAERVQFSRSARLRDTVGGEVGAADAEGQTERGHTDRHASVDPGEG